MLLDDPDNEVATTRQVRRVLGPEIGGRRTFRLLFSHPHADAGQPWTLHAEGQAGAANASGHGT